MRTARREPAGRRLLGRVLPWLAGWLAVRTAVLGTGRVLARRLDEGDESTAGIRRVRTVGALTLRPRNPELSRIRLDLLMAGGELDLTAIPRVPGGVDLTVRALMAGLAVRVPPDWRVWWAVRGPGGVGITPQAPVQRTDDERGADLRVHADLLLAGVGIEGPAREPDRSDARDRSDVPV